MKLTSQEADFMFLGKREVMKTKVKELRMTTKMTQQQLADLVHVSSRTIISIEKEQYSPSLMLAYRIAEVFGVTVEELCCLKENKELEDKQYENL
jgi:putative transcriptional regulator